MSRAFARLLARVERGGEQVAFRCDGATLSWSELDTASRRYVSALRALGVEAGDRVALIAGPSIDNVVTLVGNYRAGVVHVPVNTRYRSAELRHILDDSGARLVVADQAGFEALDELEAGGGRAGPTPLRFAIDDAVEAVADHSMRRSREEAPAQVEARSDDELALMIYTSGTTGASKGVCHSYASVVDAMLALTQLWGWSSRDHQVLALPLFHVHGLCIGVHGALLHGAETTLLRRFSPEGVHGAFEAGASLFMGVPTMYAMLLDWLEADPSRAEALRSARLFTAGSAALSARNFARFEALTGHRILERYGMSETLITVSNPYDGERRPGSVGQAVPGFELQIVDDEGTRLAPGNIGELWVRGVGLMQGYWGQPEASAAAFHEGWFRTGDVAEAAEDGYLRIVGRRSVDIIKSGGFKISAREIEECLMESGAFEEVAVLGVPDERWGERIVAALVPKQREAEADWLAYTESRLRGVLADYKRPRAVRLVDAIPKNALGKVQKHRLRGLF